MSTITLTTENWIALFAIFGVVAVAIYMTLLHQLEEKNRQYTEMENAYRTQEKEVNQRTQNLRAANNDLYREISEHEITEAKLRQTQNYLNNIIDSMPSILIGVTADGVITHWNTSAEHATAKIEADVLGKHLWDVYPTIAVDLATVREAIEQKAPKTRESFKSTAHGESRYYDIAVYPFISNNLLEDSASEAIIQVDDVTDRVMMENMVIQNEKMMSLGELAAGMAHEINNPLGTILQNVQNIERRSSASLQQNKLIAEKIGTDINAIEKYLEERQIKKFLTNIRDAGERSARIVENMLNFSHKSQNHTSVDINELISHCLELTENNLKIKYGDRQIKVKIKTGYDKSLEKIKCSPAEIQQVILNLLRNACQCFVTNNETLVTESPTVRISTKNNNDQVIIKISDNGPGMTEETARHIFEPFYSTKEVGKGTGLGLSISYFIITEHHHGSIEVKSTLEIGTEFTISLPSIT